MRERGRVREKEGREEGGRERREEEGGLTICHGVQDGHAAGVLSLHIESGSLPCDDLPHHDGKAEDITAVCVVPPWESVDIH